MRIVGIIGLLLSMAIGVRAERTEIVIMTTIEVDDTQNTQDLMVLVHEDAKFLGKKYLKQQGVKSVEIEVQNQTLLKK